jgi:hypothetical protein
MFAADQIDQTPSIRTGMSPQEERKQRAKGKKMTTFSLLERLLHKKPYNFFISLIGHVLVSSLRIPIFVFTMFCFFFYQEAQ